MAPRSWECGGLRRLRVGRADRRGVGRFPAPRRIQRREGLIPLRRGTSAPGSGVCTRRGGGVSGMRGRTAPGSGVCTRRGGGTGRIWADSPRPGCKPPQRVHSCRSGGPLSPRPGCKPPQRVHSCRSGGPLSPRPGCKPPQRVHCCRSGGPLSPRPGCKPPRRVHCCRRGSTRQPLVPGDNPRPGCQPPHRVHCCRRGGPLTRTPEIPMSRSGVHAGQLHATRPRCQCPSIRLADRASLVRQR